MPVLFKRFLKENDGNFAVILSVIAPMILGTVGLSVDYILYFDQQSKLQEAADAAALSSVKELSLAGSTEAKSNQIQEIASAYVHGIFYDNPDAKAAGAELIVKAVPDLDAAEVKVTINYRWAPMFAHFLDRKVTPIIVTAKAKLAGDNLTCVVGLMQPQTYAKSSIHMDDRSVLKADRCAVYSNSVSKYGLRADGSSEMSAQSICTSGGVITFGSADFSPEPITDCPKIEDPLLDRAAPEYTGCTSSDLVINAATEIKPGVYCGGLTISGDAEVTLLPGLYVIKNGPLNVTEKASLIGEGVSFFLTGDNSVFDFQNDTTIDLTAMETGSMAGLLFYEDRAVPYSFEFNPFKLDELPKAVRLHKISSNNARNLLGTIYLSRSILLIDANAPVADASAYTAIITGRLWLQEGPILTLNADYTDTKVPVPNGIMGTEPVLVQ